jgi:hypothetical protein
MRNQLLIFTLLLLGIYNVVLSMLDSNKATYDGFFFFFSKTKIKGFWKCFLIAQIWWTFFVCGGACYA